MKRKVIGELEPKLNGLKNETVTLISFTKLQMGEGKRILLELEGGRIVEDIEVIEQELIQFF